MWRKECKTQKIKKKARLWRKEEKQGNTEIPRKSEFMEVKRGGKSKKKTENPRKSEVMEERKRKYRNIKKKQEDGKKSLKNKGKTKLWRNGKTQKKDGVALKVNERWLQK